MLGLLRHPSILSILDVVRLEDRVGLVTEYVEGADLEWCVEAGMPPRAAAEAIGAVALALHAAYTQDVEGTPLGVVHRDIKPQNIRVSRHGEVKLLDFGIARAENLEREAHTLVSGFIGTPAYGAPERLTGIAHDKPESDVFSLGCVLYEVLTGQRVFTKDLTPRGGRWPLRPDALDRVLAARFGRVEAQADLRGVLPLIEAMLRFDVEQRPTSEQVASELERLAPRLPGPSLARWCRDTAWPEVPSSRTGLVDRVLIESEDGQTVTLDAPVADFPLRVGSPPLRSSKGASSLSSRSAMWLASVIVVELVALGALAAVAAAGMALWPGTGERTPGPVAASSEAGAATSAAAAVADDTGIAGAPEPAVAPVRPVPPQPEVSIEPLPEPPAGRVEVTGDVPVRLSDGVHDHPPGALAAGTYEVWADFGRGFEATGVAVGVSDNGSVRVRCSQVRESCWEET
jgi:serine/threonine-protein kinase